MTKPTHLAPRDICDRLAIGMDPVLTWIHSKQLKAVNVSNSSLRPRWRIAERDLEEFLSSRSNQPDEKSSSRVEAKSKPKREFIE